MNEVNTKLPASVAVAGQSSSKGGGSINTSAVEQDRQLPVNEGKKEGNKVNEPVASTEQLSKAVAHMNEFIQNEQRNLSFSIDETSGMTVVRVTDKVSGELIRQMPNQAFLDLAESVKKDDPLRLISVYG